MNVYNILPLDDTQSLNRFPPQVRQALEILRACVRGLPLASDEHDAMAWLARQFGFQKNNVKNQKEHVVLLLANYLMMDNPDWRSNGKDVSSQPCANKALTALRTSVLENYETWCSFLRMHEDEKWVPKNYSPQEMILFPSLYLLIWGEASNLRFMPECLCFIYHHMARELRWILDRKPFSDRKDCKELPDQEECKPFSYGDEQFLEKIVSPIYKVVMEESMKGDVKVSYGSWRNYEDMNDFFWSRKCLDMADDDKTARKKRLYGKNKLNKSCEWTLNEKHEFFQAGRKGKAWYVESPSVVNLYRDFDYMWIVLTLVLEGMVMWAFGGRPFKVMMCTWAGLRLLDALLSFCTQRRRRRQRQRLRRCLRITVAIVWFIAFLLLSLHHWLPSNRILIAFLIAFLFPELLAILLFFIPANRNYVDTSDLSLARLLTSWSLGNRFLGRGLRENIPDNLLYTSFWLLVFSLKFSFSYFLQIRPLVQPTRALLRLGHETFAWHEFFSYHHRFAVAILWAPVILIYFVDTQIWYSLVTAFVGAAVGLFHRRSWCIPNDIRRLKELFPLFAQNAHRNLLQIPQPASPQPERWSRVKEFAPLWNQIIKNLREDDLLSNTEVEQLQFPEEVLVSRRPQQTKQLRIEDGSVHEPLIIRYPPVVVSKSLRDALRIAKRWKFWRDALPKAARWNCWCGKYADEALWKKVSEEECRKFAVREIHESVLLLLEKILKEGSEEYRRFEAAKRKIKGTLENDDFAKLYLLSTKRRLLNIDCTRMDKLYSAAQRLVTNLFGSGGETDDDVKKEAVAGTLQQMYDIVMDNSSENSDFKFQTSALVLPNSEIMSQFRRLHAILTTSPDEGVPENPKARHRLAFFGSSVFMTMPPPQSVKNTRSFSVLTSHDKEDVLRKEEGQSSTQSFKDERRNFQERKGSMSRRPDEGTLWESYRDQTLARTIHSMRYYPLALQEQVVAPGTKADEDSTMILLKFTQVVACQKRKKNNDSAITPDLSSLMRMHPQFLRVAYVEEVGDGRKKQYYSVLVKYDDKAGNEVEVYKVKLPGECMLGESKAETQNQALIFTRGDAVQAMDEDQELFFEEALKIRNVMNEFSCSKARSKRPKIVGVGQHIADDEELSAAWSFSRVASFTSMKEKCFARFTQRVLAMPLKVRIHYGHSDFFDRLWFLSRGGINNASKSLNTSHGVFAAFNCILRNGSVTHIPYFQVAKSFPLTLSQISASEAQAAVGYGEQLHSRAVYRLAHAVDFIRKFSFFHSTVGFYVCQAFVLLAAYVWLWGRVFLALSGLESDLVEEEGFDFFAPPAQQLINYSTAQQFNSSYLAAPLAQQLFVEMGFLYLVPIFVQQSLDGGRFFVVAWGHLLRMQLQLCSVFFAFLLGVQGYYFLRTLLHGGAELRPSTSGRQRVPFAENYRLYSRSHFINALELVLLLSIYEAFRHRTSTVTASYILLTFSSWFLAMAWLTAPFLFNPSGLWLKENLRDCRYFVSWIWTSSCHPDLNRQPVQTWEEWWYGGMRDLEEKSSAWSKVIQIILALRFFVIQYGIVYRLHIAAHSKSIVVYVISWSVPLLVLCAYAIVEMVANLTSSQQRVQQIFVKATQILQVGVFIAGLVLLKTFTHFRISDLFLSLLGFIPTGWGLLCIATLYRGALQCQVVRDFCRYYDLAFGLIVFIPLGLLSCITDIWKSLTSS